jgi:hypothetical protein
MSVAPQVLAAVVGGLLVWILSGVTAGLRNRIERRRAILLALSVLVAAYTRLLTLMGALKTFKAGTGTWKEFETFRDRAFSRHAKFFDRSDAELEKLIDAVAAHEPFLAIRFRSQIHLLGKMAMSGLSTTLEASQESYVKILSLHEVATEAQAAELLKLTKRLAWAGGILTRVKLGFYLHRRRPDSNVQKKNRAFLTDFFTQAYGEATQRARSVSADAQRNSQEKSDRGGQTRSSNLAHG